MKKNKDINFYRRRQFIVERLISFYKDINVNYYLFLICMVAIYICMDLMKIFNIELVHTIGIFLTIIFVEFSFIIFSIVALLILKVLKKHYFNKVRFLFNEELKERKN